MTYFHLFACTPTKNSSNSGNDTKTGHTGWFVNQNNSIIIHQVAIIPYYRPDGFLVCLVYHGERYQELMQAAFGD